MSSKGKYKNKYRIPSARLQGWDYRNEGAYFITICTKNREHYFGEIIKGKMNLSNIGVLADVFWHEIKNHTKNVTLDAFIVMPNHIHGILFLNGDDGDSIKPIETLHAGSSDVQTLHAGSSDVQTLHAGSSDVQTLHAGSSDVQTLHATSLANSSNSSNQSKNEFMKSISPKSNSISTIIKSYKSAVTRHAHRLGYEFEWQTRFHDHIIRDELSYINIANYIEANVANWKEDKFFANENTVYQEE